MSFKERRIAKASNYFTQYIISRKYCYLSSNLCGKKKKKSLSVIWEDL